MTLWYKGLKNRKFSLVTHILVDFIMCSVLLDYRTNSFLVFNNPCITRWKMNNNRKRHFHFYSDASKDQMFTLLDAVKSDNEDEIDELINDLDMEFIAPGDMKLTDNSGNVSNLTLEANAHVVDQGNTRTKELETSNKRKKIQKKVSRSYENATFLHILKRREQSYSPI